METLTSRKLVAVVAGIIGAVGLAAIQAFQGGLSDQQFILTMTAITVLSGGGAITQGIIDGMKVGK